jgi:hypothetical protein
VCKKGADERGHNAHQREPAGHITGLQNTQEAEGMAQQYVLLQHTETERCLLVQLGPTVCAAMRKVEVVTRRYGPFAG